MSAPLPSTPREVKQVTTGCRNRRKSTPIRRRGGSARRKHGLFLVRQGSVSRHATGICDAGEQAAGNASRQPADGRTDRRHDVVRGEAGCRRGRRQSWHSDTRISAATTPDPAARHAAPRCRTRRTPPHSAPAPPRDGIAARLQLGEPGEPGVIVAEERFHWWAARPRDPARRRPVTIGRGTAPTLGFRRAERSAAEEVK